jgi:hypothetical protein
MDQMLIDGFHRSKPKLKQNRSSFFCRRRRRESLLMADRR